MSTREHVTFVTTMVDRITPRATEADRDALLAATGIDDPACVVTEPYVEWVLSGEFAGGRPAWDSVGARFVDDIRPFVACLRAGTLGVAQAVSFRLGRIAVDRGSALNHPRKQLARIVGSDDR